MITSPKRGLFVVLMLVLLTNAANADLQSDFKNPPPAARPWVYWFWNNGNVTKAGITADLEAMQRVGIGGVIIMDVVERFAPPPGTADFMNAQWQGLFQHAVVEAHRLGLEINMTNGPGWCGSSGPWVTPELSMQHLVASEVTVEGPKKFDGVIPKPDTLDKQSRDVFNSKVEFKEFYRDVAVLAYYEPSGAPFVVPENVQDLTQKLRADGKLEWDVPQGRWIIQRFGYASTGSSTRPPVKGGNGLEVDKLSAAAFDVHFDNMMAKLIATAGPMAGPTLSATHIDSWEVGSQNWTANLPAEFKKRRGYDLTRFLPNIIAPVEKLNVGGDQTAAKFRWDFDQTVSELLAENYAGRLATRAHEHGMRFTMEGYDLPFGDEANYTGRADEPMTEFWSTGESHNGPRTIEMASVAHVMGHKVVGAEAFTANERDRWILHPASVKALGDYEFSLGVNRFVIHRYAHQPFLDKVPGATMGPWGLHYERTNTWWEMSGAWHQYLSRCQQMLRQGLFVADVCYLRPQHPNQTRFTPNPPIPDGYRYDEISAEALIDRMTVKDGTLTLPDGMSYRLLVLPSDTNITPALAGKIKQLVADGATVYGPRPTGSPSLSEYPKCEEQVRAIASEVWADCDGTTVAEHSFGKGRVILGPTLAATLKRLGVTPDFSATTKLNWIHRDVDGTQVYFVANDAAVAVETHATFRVKDARPQRWDAETGEMAPVAMYESSPTGVSIPLRLEASQSAFIVFRPAQAAFDPVVSISLDGKPAIAPTEQPKVTIQSANYGILDDEKRTRDVTAKVQALFDRGVASFKVADLAAGDDPAYGVVKTLVVQYVADGKEVRRSGKDTDTFTLRAPLAAAPVRAGDVQVDASGKCVLVASHPGTFEVKMAGGRTESVRVASVAGPVEIDGPWEVSFPPKSGAPEHVTFDRLVSLAARPEDGVKHFSGTATYAKTFDYHPAAGADAASDVWLDLGDIQVLARVKLNGVELGTFWRPPFRVNVTLALKPGENTLEVRVANLWPNRMIGDSALPAEKRFTWSSYEPFKPDSPLLPSGLIGPVKLISDTKVGLKLP